MAKDRLDEFLFRGFIPEENRGGAYHVVLLLNDKLVGPCTPEMANDLGWPLPAIMADMNRQMLSELNAVKGNLRAVSAELEAETRRRVEAEGQIESARLAAEASGPEKRSLLNVVSFGMLDKG